MLLQRRLAIGAQIDQSNDPYFARNWELFARL
jgi:hypothetical protein